MAYKISIIIPIYNAEQLVQRVINSIINQTIGFENIELILVDDKSTDNSRKILKVNENKYENCKCIFLDKNSGGCATPRNYGIKEATGEYIMFADADDILLPDCCETVFNVAKQTNAEIVHFQNIRGINNKYYIEKTHSMNKSYEIIDDISKRITLRLTAWGNLFSTALLKKHNMKFEIIPISEDVIFDLEIFIKADIFVKMSEYYGYIYILEQGNETVTDTISFLKCMAFLESYELANNILIQNNLQECKQDFFNILIPMLYFSFFKLKESKTAKIKILKEYKRVFESLNIEIRLKSQPLNYIHKALMNGKFNKVIFLSNCASLLYTNRQLKKISFKLYSNVKKVELE